jgi:zinc transport system ATP-binding protein
MSEPAIQLEDLWVRLGGRTVLEAVSLEVPEGAYMALIGPNGAGKTVLLKTMLGLITPERGRVRLLGRSVREARGLVGYVPQHAAFERDFPIRVKDVVLMGRLRRGRMLRRLGAEDRGAASEALERVEASELADRQIGSLSGGQLQRVLIARALAMRPRLLLLDEPTSNLDPRLGAGLYDVLERLRGSMTIVVVSHDLGVVARHVESVACLSRTLHFHPASEITQEEIESIYGCPVDFIVHRHTHRVLEAHEGDEA